MTKALESLAGADSELANRRFNNCANRAYYACYQAAIAAVTRDGIQSTGVQWSHEGGASSFDGILINRRTRYGSDLRGTIDRIHAVRVRADYGLQYVSEVEMQRIIRRARSFVAAINEHGEKGP